MAIIQERWDEIQKLSLKPGAHNPDSTFCVMEAVAYIAGENWSDHPSCVPPVIAEFLRRWNDRLPTDADRDRLLKPLIPKIIGLPMDAATEMRRAVMIGDWGLRTVIPELLRLRKMNALADLISHRHEAITQKELGKSAKSIREILRKSGIAIASDIASAIASAIAIDSAIVSDIDSAIVSAIASAIERNIERSQSALVERMIECTVT